MFCDKLSTLLLLIIQSAMCVRMKAKVAIEIILQPPLSASLNSFAAKLIKQ
jgi:hypothetical protein